MKDWLKYLCCQNDKAIPWHDTLSIDLRASHPLEDDIISPLSVFGIVYKWCQQLKQPVGVSYCTAELFENFPNLIALKHSVRKQQSSNQNS
ncbi:hypothetical protein DAPPUDRAFT_304926 [Daphnia pulex]|uniref:Uncharacterized protein n=1 Tax=Daphnia pulex TaxID=6669 RepID=E9GML0_DAPPU|nr:hypothetical protein DAPPUDRAFT_304926 [Daphnia pulex]|eukprot:EFX79276.1 hypothetical protein DAPPUDRAFT_304926 [Daphnia pulex]